MNATIPKAPLILPLPPVPVCAAASLIIEPGPTLLHRSLVFFHSHPRPPRRIIGAPGCYHNNNGGHQVTDDETCCAKSTLISCGTTTNGVKSLIHLPNIICRPSSIGHTPQYAFSQAMPTESHVNSISIITGRTTERWEEETDLINFGHVLRKKGSFPTQFEVNQIPHG